VSSAPSGSASLLRQATADTGTRASKTSANKVVFPRLQKRRKAYEEVADTIRGLIFEGRVSLGERLPSEREMAEQFGVSRVAVREAIRTLELTGFVTVRKGAQGGAFVAQDYDRPIAELIENMLTAGEVGFGQLFDVRRLIEPFAAARLAARANVEEVAQLTAVIEEAEQRNAEGLNIRPFNARFHRLIVRLADNPIMALMGEIVLAIILARIQDVPSAEIGPAHLDFHRAILDAIGRGDAEDARSLMLQDIADLERRFGDWAE